LEKIYSYFDLLISDNYDNKASTAVDYSDINEVVEEETDKSFAFVGLYICWLCNQFY
jgi:hypothetical protein